ncbi:MAG: hypothetical protein WBW71_14005 [Bacteroidota bacterium]
MKTILSIFNLLSFFLIAGFFFAGCYTRMETMSDEGSGAGDNGDYAYADSSGASNDTTGNNYFSDDDYRSSQYRSAFDYYYPPTYGWDTGIDPGYGDYGYPWDATLVYPYPYWYGSYPYYGWGWGFGYGYGYGYGHYYNGGYRGGRGGPFYGGRLRTIGSTRGEGGFLSARGAAGVPGTIPAASRVASSRTSSVQDVVASNARTRSRQEIPWWERGKATSENSQARSGVVTRTQSARGNVSMFNRARNVRTPSNYSMNARRMAQYRGRTQSAWVRRYGSQSRPSGRQQAPHSFSPQGAGGRSSGGGGGGSRGGGGGSRGGGGGSRSK